MAYSNTAKTADGRLINYFVTCTFIGIPALGIEKKVDYPTFAGAEKEAIDIISGYFFDTEDGFVRSEL